MVSRTETGVEGAPEHLSKFKKTREKKRKKERLYGSSENEGSEELNKILEFHG
jgi:hypothetical protein